jgi:hypothetical protein
MSTAAVKRAHAVLAKAKKAQEKKKKAAAKKAEKKKIRQQIKTLQGKLKRK